MSASVIQNIRTAAQSKVIVGLQNLPSQLSIIQGLLAAGTLPKNLLGQVQQPDSSAGALLQVEFDPSTINAKGTVVTALTDDAGNFTLPMPAGASVPAAGITLTIRGANASPVTVTLLAKQIASNGLVGVLLLPQALAPLPVSIIAALNALVPPSTPPALSTGVAKGPFHTLKLGEGDAPCTQSFDTVQSVDTFPYGIFCRLIEPQMSNAYPVQPGQGSGNSNFTSFSPSYSSSAVAAAQAAVATAQQVLNAAESAGSSSAAVTQAQQALLSAQQGLFIALAAASNVPEVQTALAAVNTAQQSLVAAELADPSSSATTQAQTALQSDIGGLAIVYAGTSTSPAVVTALAAANNAEQALVAAELSDPSSSATTQAKQALQAAQNAVIAAIATAAAPTGPITYTDRVPVEQPLDVEGFQAGIAGLDPTGSVFVDGGSIPVAATLGLGYVLWMAQQWRLQGLGLGDLVYSVPLAPGEQQQIAVFERTDTSSVFESESYSDQETMSQQALSDTSTQATVNSTFNEFVNGSSSFNSNSTTQSGSLSVGVAGIIPSAPVLLGAGASGSTGSSSDSGSSASNLNGQRDFAQSTAQDVQSSAENQAAARRSANRTGMRLATASESEAVTTKVLTNHNHTRALTLQYWEVQRIYSVTTAIDGLTLACLVPLKPIQFMPPGQPLTIQDLSTMNAQLGTRQAVLQRYSGLIKHLDVLQQTVPRPLQYGLTLLAQFASDPSAQVDPSGGVAEDVINLSIQGSFVPCDIVTVTAITRRNTRIGPAMLSAASTSSALPADTFASQDDLLAYLLNQRQNGSVALAGALALPQSLNRSDIVGFEITRVFENLSYTLVSPLMVSVDALGLPTGSSTNTWQSIAGSTTSPVIDLLESALTAAKDVTSRVTITVTPEVLEQAIGGPRVTSFYASIQELSGSGAAGNSPANESYANDTLNGVVLPPRPYPIPAIQIAPVLRYTEILEIEKTALHVVRNSTAYSRAVWTALTAEERAMLLDCYTIGVPPGGLTDASQMVPLLNCVQNKVLGFFGNSMILPFSIPPEVAQMMKIDPGQIQRSLLAFQQAGFEPPQSTVALPTRGVLGEAVLGHCPSAEKIDLTRFWNWQDSPADTAPAISPVSLPTSSASLTAGLTAPNSLASTPPLINNILQAPQPNTSLLQSMAQTAGSQQDFSSALTNAAQLASLMQTSSNNANSARADSLKSTTNLAAQAMATLGNLVGSGMISAGGSSSSAGSDAKGSNSAGKAAAAGTTTAGTSALNAIYGTQQGSSSQSSGQKSQGSGGGVTITIQVPGVSGPATVASNASSAAPATPQPAANPSVQFV